MDGPILEWSKPRRQPWTWRRRAFCLLGLMCLAAAGSAAAWLFSTIGRLFQ